MTSGQTDVVKQQIAADWNRRAPLFDEDFGHSIRPPAERAAWDAKLAPMRMSSAYLKRDIPSPNAAQ